jgi:hypothetical protein
MTPLGELRIVEGLVRRLEIGAAILPVGIEEERVEPPIEIVVVGNVVSARRDAPPAAASNG